MTSQELYTKERELKAQIIETLQTLIGDETFTFETPFEDDCNNTITSIDKENVTCKDTVYCVNDLSVDDGIYIVSILESR